MATRKRRKSYGIKLRRSSIHTLDRGLVRTQRVSSRKAYIPNPFLSRQLHKRIISQPVMVSGAIKKDNSHRKTLQNQVAQGPLRDWCRQKKAKARRAYLSWIASGNGTSKKPRRNHEDRFDSKCL